MSHVHVNNDSSDDDLYEMEHITRSENIQVQLRPKKDSKSHMMGEALSVWNKASLTKVERYRDRSVEAISRVTSYCSVIECVTVLDEMEDIPRDAYGKVLEKFMNFDRREVFMTMFVERRSGWALIL